MDQDQELVMLRGLRAHNDASILQFVRHYQDQVYRQAHQLLRNQQDAEDVCQDIFMKALKAVEKFEGKSRVSTWLYQITYRTCLDALKKRKRQGNESDIDEMEDVSWSELDNGLSILEKTEQKTIIDESIAKLGEVDAQLIELYHLQDLPVKEITDITGMSEGSIKIRMMRARKKLATLLENSLPGETIEKLTNDGKKRF